MGDTPFACAREYTGALCGECAAGHFRLGRHCYACPESEGAQWVMHVAVTASCICLWALIGRFLRREWLGLDVALWFAQNVQIVMYYRAHWPPFMRLFFDAFHLLLLDSDWLHFGCLSHRQSNPRMSLYMQLVLPLALVACYWLMEKARSRNDSPPSAVEPQPPPNEPIPDGFVRTVVRPVPTQHHAVKVSLLTLGIASYSVIAIKCLSVLDCQQLPDGSVVLSSYAANECWTATHWEVIIIAWVALALFSAGLPVVVGLLIVSPAAQHMASRPEVLRLHFIGVVTLKYKFRSYEVLVLVRRFCLVLITLLHHDAAVQLLLALLVLGLSLVVQCSLQPFVEPRLARAEVLSLGCVATLLLLGYVSLFDANALTPPPPNRKDGLGALMIAITSIGVVGMGALLTLTCYAQRARIKLTSTLQKTSPEVPNEMTALVAMLDPTKVQRICALPDRPLLDLTRITLWLEAARGPVGEWKGLSETTALTAAILGSCSHLAAGCPLLVDWLASASKEQAELFAELVSALAQFKLKRYGTTTQHADPIYTVFQPQTLGEVLVWLKLARPRQRQTFNRLMRFVCRPLPAQTGTTPVELYGMDEDEENSPQKTDLATKPTIVWGGAREDLGGGREV